MVAKLCREAEWEAHTIGGGNGCGEADARAEQDNFLVHITQNIFCLTGGVIQPAGEFIRL